MAKAGTGDDDGEDPRIKPVEKGAEDPRIQAVGPAIPDARIEFVATTRGVGAVPRGVDVRRAERAGARSGGVTVPLDEFVGATALASRFPTPDESIGERFACLEPSIAYTDPAPGNDFGRLVVSFIYAGTATAPSYTPSNAETQVFLPGGAGPDPRLQGVFGGMHVPVADSIREFPISGIFEVGFRPFGWAWSEDGRNWTVNRTDRGATVAMVRGATEAERQVGWGPNSRVAANPNPARRGQVAIVSPSISSGRATIFRRFSGPLVVPPGSGEGPRPLTLPQGDLLVAAMSDDAGGSFSRASLVRRTDRNIDFPDMVFASDGTMWVAWVEYGLLGLGRSVKIRGGDPWRPPGAEWFGEPIDVPVPTRVGLDTADPSLPRLQVAITPAGYKITITTLVSRMGHYAFTVQVGTYSSATAAWNWLDADVAILDTNVPAGSDAVVRGTGGARWSQQVPLYAPVTRATADVTVVAIPRLEFGDVRFTIFARTGDRERFEDVFTPLPLGGLSAFCPQLAPSAGGGVGLTWYETLSLGRVTVMASGAEMPAIAASWNPEVQLIPDRESFVPRSVLRSRAGYGDAFAGDGTVEASIAADKPLGDYFGICRVPNGMPFGFMAGSSFAVAYTDTSSVGIHPGSDVARIGVRGFFVTPP